MKKKITDPNFYFGDWFFVDFEGWEVAPMTIIGFDKKFKGTRFDIRHRHYKGRFLVKEINLTVINI